MIANRLTHHLRGIFDVIEPIGHAFQTLKHAVYRHIIGMIGSELQAQLVTEMLEEMHLMLIVSVHKVSNINVLIAIPIGQCFGNADQICQHRLNASTAVVDGIGFLSETRDCNRKVPEFKGF